ncbi:uncharacterized protein KQ657_002271 [Scheffersomyces spartinae]|uniref:Peptide hydrolase n=1 Tax=Scheffersomyces spartinae TaxID=45513 RepID=A0A9P8AKH2_9ASCO|nr:uncharacterized protein KQ657_002271 [Scheffersomyces spartinae]KAG7195886.1 hypothetical protein KQ657_002271 [Scheffersomyces spartinae]
MTTLAISAIVSLVEDTKPEVRGCRLEKRVVKQELIDEAVSLMNYVSKSYNGSDTSITRSIRTPGFDATYHYVAQELNKLSEFYDVFTQLFMVPKWQANSHLITINNMDFLNSTVIEGSPGGETHGNVNVALNYGCFPKDYFLFGKIFIVKKGQCSYLDKIQAASEASVSGLLIYDDSSDTNPHIQLKGRFGTQVHVTIPAFGISANDARNLIEKSKKKKNPYIRTQLNSTTSYLKFGNIIATSKSGNQSNIVMAGATMDSSNGSKGVNDNGSGVISLLNIAKYLTSFELHNAVKLSWWGGGNHRAFGSVNYEWAGGNDIDKVQVYLDLNTLASPNYGYLIPNYSPLTKDFSKYFSAKGIPYKEVDFGFDSKIFINDLWVFSDLGIPSGSANAGKLHLKDGDAVQKFGGVVNTPYDLCNGLSCDDISNLNLDVWFNMTKAYAYLIGAYSNSIENVPKIPIKSGKILN